jgi:predicted nucleic acid-binding protein
MSLRPFLDANVLFTAAYNPKGLARLLFDLGKRKAISLVTSSLALEEARINLEVKKSSALAELESLIKSLEIVQSPAHFPAVLELPPKDLAIFAAAVAGRATHLLTGDKKHFGRYFNKPSATRGIIIQSVRDFFVDNLGL